MGVVGPWVSPCAAAASMRTARVSWTACSLAQGLRSAAPTRPAQPRAGICNMHQKAVVMSLFDAAPRPLIHCSFQGDFGCPDQTSPG